MDAKISGQKFKMKQDLCSSEYLPKKFKYKGDVSFSGRQYHNWVIKVNITINKSYWHLGKMHSGYNIIFLLFLPKMYNFIPIMRKHQQNPSWRTDYKISTLQKCQIQFLGAVF